MKNKHIDDIEIQQYLLQETISDTDLIEHIQQCEKCWLKVEQYKTIFEVVKEQEKAAFDFNLTELVLKQLPRNKPSFSPGKFLIYFFVLFALPMAIVLIYLFNSSLSGLATGLTPILIYLISTTVAGLLFFQFFDTYIKYRNRMNAINFY